MAEKVEGVGGSIPEAAIQALALQLQALGKWLDEEEGKQVKVAAHEEPVLQSSTISSRVVQLRNAFEKLNKKKKPAPPPAPKQRANTTGTACFCLPAGFRACGMPLTERNNSTLVMPAFMTCSDNLVPCCLQCL